MNLILELLYPIIKGIFSVIWESRDEAIEAKSIVDDATVLEFFSRKRM